MQIFTQFFNENSICYSLIYSSFAGRIVKRRYEEFLRVIKYFGSYTFKNTKELSSINSYCISLLMNIATPLPLEYVLALLMNTKPSKLILRLCHVSWQKITEILDLLKVKASMKLVILF